MYIQTNLYTHIKYYFHKNTKNRMKIYTGIII